MVEADADAVASSTVERNFVAQPAFPQKQAAGLWGFARMSAKLARRRSFARWCRHQQAKAGVFEHDGARTFGNRYIISAADHRIAVNVGSVGTALGHDIDPH